MISKAFCFVLFFIAFEAYSQTQALIQVSELRSNEGHIIVAIFDNEKSFVDEDPKMHKTFKKTKVKNGRLNLRFDLPAGSYGITIVDDENKNGEMDYNFVGMPKEGFGFSDYYHTGLTKPTLNDFKVQIKKGKTNKINCKVRYI